MSSLASRRGIIQGRNWGLRDLKKLKVRLDAFSDAVIAIILTIMVLDLTPVMKDNWTNYLMLAKEIGVYFISFALVANMWYQHATTFNEIDDMSYRIMLYDFLYLAVLSLTPLATNMMAGNTTRITVIAYGVLSAVVSFTFRLLARAVLHFQYTDKSEMRQVYGKIYGEHNQFYAFLNIGLLVLAYFFPTVVVWFYLAYPVTNLLLSSRDRQQMYDVAQLTPEQRKEYLQLPREQMKAYRKMVDEQNAAAATAAANGQPGATKPAATDWTGVLSHWLDSRIGARPDRDAVTAGPGAADIDRIRQARQEQWEQFVQQQKTIRSAQHTARHTQHDQRHITRDTQKQDADAAERALKLQQAAIDNAAKIAAQRRDAEAADQRAAAKAADQKRKDDEAAQKAAAKATAKAAEQQREAEEDARAAAAETEANRREEERDAQLADAKLAAKQHKIDLKSQRREAKAAAHIAHDQAKAEKKAAKNQDKNAADQPTEQVGAEQTPNSAAADASSAESNSGKQS